MARCGERLLIGNFHKQKRKLLLFNGTLGNDKSAERKLTLIKEHRLQRLQETDYLANSDMDMPENIKTWRQSLRDIPENYTTEEQYDLLLVRVDKKLTHAIWSKS